MSIDEISPQDGGGKEFENCPADTHAAIVVGVIDLGTHDTMYQGQKKQAHKIRLVFETPFAKTSEDKPFIVVEKWTYSLAPSANFRKLLESWRGKKFEDSEKFQVKSLLGVKCMIQVIHSPKKGEEGFWVNVGAVTKIPRNPATNAPMFEVPPPVNPIKYLSLGREFDKAVFDSLGKKTREYIAESYEFKTLFPGGLWAKPAAENVTRTTPASAEEAPWPDEDDERAPASTPAAAGTVYDDDIPF